MPVDDDSNSNDEFELAVPPVNLNEAPSQPSGPIGQVAEGLWEAAEEGITGAVQLAVDTAKAVYDTATTDEGKNAAWETAKSMLKDAASLTPFAPKEWQDDMDRRIGEWFKAAIDGLKSEWDEATDHNEEVKFAAKKIGWAVIAIIAKKSAPKVCVKCGKGHNQKSKPTTTNTSKDALEPQIDPKTERKIYPNSPYIDKTRHPSEIALEIERNKDKFDPVESNRRIALQNMEIDRIHREFIETGKWDLKRKDLGEYHLSVPDAELIKAREQFLKDNGKS